MSSREIPNPIEHPSAEAEAEKPFESRFGNRSEILHELDENPVSIIGPIGDHLPNIAPHTNQVDLATVEESHLSDTRLAHVDDERGGFFAVFKPFDGENSEVKAKTGIGSFYTREIISGRVAEDILRLDVTTPITVRIIEDQIGSLQQLLDIERYITVTQLMEKAGDLTAAMEELESCDDFMRIALLDFATLGADRSDDNMMPRVKKATDGTFMPDFTDSEPSVVGIDNGVSLSLRAYNMDPRIVGPAMTLTGENTPTKVVARHTPIPEKHLDLLSDGLRRWDDVIERSGNLISAEEQYAPGDVPSLAVELAWAKQRIQALLEERIFLSRVNCHRLPESVTRDSAHPHPPFKPYQPTVVHPFLMPIKRK